MGFGLPGEISAQVDIMLLNDTWFRDLNTDLALGDCLLVAMKFSKNADPDKYQYSGYGIGFHAH